MKISTACGGLISNVLLQGLPIPGWSLRRTSVCGGLLRWSRSLFLADTRKSCEKWRARTPNLRRRFWGFIVALDAPSRGVGHILTIDVPPASRRFGIGSRLLTTAEDRLGAAGCHSVMLETAVDNSAALAFYKQHNYCVAKTIPRYYSNGVDAFVLEKELLSSSRDK